MTLTSRQARGIQKKEKRNGTKKQKQKTKNRKTKAYVCTFVRSGQTPPKKKFVVSPVWKVCFTVHSAPAPLPLGLSFAMTCSSIAKGSFSL
jgi:hypothetical protein